MKLQSFETDFADTKRCIEVRKPSLWHAISLIAGVSATALTSSPALADPAADTANFSQTTAGAISTTVPDGTCSVVTATRGGAGASSGTTAAMGGRGAGGAIINARFNVLPGQAVTGAVASGGLVAASLTGANAGSGTAAGGNGGPVTTGTTLHRGGGGGGSSSLSFGGIKVVEAGGGGGGGAAHQATVVSGTILVGDGGGGGFTGIAAGVVAPGINGTVGNNVTNNGGQGGQAAAGGAGGVYTPTTTNGFNGNPGSGIGTGTGGNGANDFGTDTGGGGGGGYTGGGGGSSTVGDSATGAGGGGGSSFVRATSPTVSAAAPTGVSGSGGALTAGGAVAGAAGSVTIDWVPCVYSLAVTKTASATSVNAGQAVRWTITVRNSGTDPMTKGDIVSLTDTLPSGGGSVFKVVSVGTAGGSNTDMANGAVTCTGVTVGGTMPATTDCSRAYSAPSAPGAPSGGTRGLNAGETLTIVYDQVFNNAIPAASLTNQASTVDRSSTTGTTDIIGVNATKSATASTAVVPYDLRVVKTSSATGLPTGSVITWTINVTNLGPGDMFGPDASVANPLIVTDVAPTGSVTGPTGFASSGPAGTCTYTAGTITCPNGLPLNGTQTFTFQQTINTGVAAGTAINNTASAVDYTSGDSNDSGGATVTVQASADLRITKTDGVVTRFSGSTTTYTVVVTNVGPDAVTGARVTDVVGAGLTCPGTNVVTITGSGVPGGSFTISNLTGAGIALGTLNSGQSATLSYSCQVN